MDIEKAKAKEYQSITENYYPIETIVYGIKNNKKDFINKGRKIIRKRGSNYVRNQKINIKKL